MTPHSNKGLGLTKFSSLKNSKKNLFKDENESNDQLFKK